MKNKVVLSLFDYSGVMIKPWAKAGYQCYCVDTYHKGIKKEGNITYIEADIMNYLPPRKEYRIVFSFPPCTNLSVSGARWFKDKGLNGLSEGIKLVERARQICEWCSAPWMIENPISVLSTYWREPDYIFHPYEYDGYTKDDNAYSKKTCLWTSKDFKMPIKIPAKKFDNRIHMMGPSEDRGRKRSLTPEGFAIAVYKANEGLIEIENFEKKEIDDWI